MMRLARFEADWVSGVGSSMDFDALAANESVPPRGSGERLRQPRRIERWRGVGGKGIARCSVFRSRATSQLIRPCHVAVMGMPALSSPLSVAIVGRGRRPAPPAGRPPAEPALLII